MSLAIAASLILLAVVRLQPVNGPAQAYNAATVDLSEYVNLAAQQPSLALTAMAKRFHGKEVVLGDAEDLLGYQPTIVQALPTDTRLVVTKALTLPSCECKGGECTCGPSGCNCAASLCRRKDGSEFLVLKHCRSQNISLGGMAMESSSRNAGNLQLVSSGDRFAASWVANNRRMTAIGLKDVAEAERLSVRSIAATTTH